MFSLLIFLITTILIKNLQAQIAPVYPNNNYNYNNYVTYRPPVNLQPTFSDLNGQSYTTPSPYANVYGSNINTQTDYNKIRIWPFVIDQYLPYPYNNNYYNNYPYNNAAMLSYNGNKDPSYNTALWYQQYYGKK